MKKNVLGVAAAAALMVFSSSSFAGTSVGVISFAGVQKGLAYFAKFDELDSSYQPDNDFETECNTWLGPLVALEGIDAENKEIINILQSSIVTKIPVLINYEMKALDSDPTGPEYCVIVGAALGQL